MQYMIWIYTKSGNKKRYVTDTGELLSTDGNIKGKCIKTDIHFVIKADNIDIFEVQELPNG